MFDSIKVVFSNHIINVSLISWFVAQGLKVVFTLIFKQKLDLSRFWGAGGMPSSHSSFVTSIVIVSVKVYGFNSGIFGLALAFAVIVMHDAMGVRRSAGEHAKLLNKIVFFWPGAANDSNEEDEDNDEQQKPFEAKALKEFIGHTPLEVVGGSLLGILIAMIYPV